MLDVMYQVNAKRDWRTYHTVVHCLKRYEKTDWRGVLLLCETVLNDNEMDRMGGEANDFYKFALLLCKHAEELPAAIAVFKSLRLAGVVPNRDVCSSLLSHCHSNFAGREALVVFNTMCENDIDIDIEDVNLVLRSFRAPSGPFQLTLEEYFRGSNKQADILRAEELFERMTVGRFGRGERIKETKLILDKFKICIKCTQTSPKPC